MTKPGSQRFADYRLERLTPENGPLWDEFNASCPEGSIFHSLKWKRIAENLSGTPGEYFLLFRDDEIFGLFSLTEHVIHGFRGLVSASYPQSLHVLFGITGIHSRSPLSLINSRGWRMAHNRSPSSVPPHCTGIHSSRSHTTPNIPIHSPWTIGRKI